MATILLPIAPGATDTGLVPGDFAVIQYVNWNTTYWASLKDGMNWTLQFNTPAPPDGSGRVGYLGGAPPAIGTMTLGDYLDEVRRLLHDQNTGGGNTYSDADLIKDINKAVKQRDLRSNGSLAYRQDVALTVGQDIYTLPNLFPDLVVLDVINIWLIYGQTRVLLNNPTFTDVTSKSRVHTGFQNRPAAWARRSATVYIAPKPSFAYRTDWDLSVLSTTLVNLTDTDPLVYPYTEPVPYYACYMACINARRWDLADSFQGLFFKSMQDIEGSRIGEMQDYYATHGGRRRGARA